MVASAWCVVRTRCGPCAGTGFILYRDEDPAHFDTIIEAFVFTLFRACTLEDWTDLFYTTYYGCESYGYVAPTPQHTCSRYEAGAESIYLDRPEP